MATYVNNLRLKEIATGDESGTWGTSTNTNLELIGEALGIGTEAITTNANTHTTTVADGSSDAGRAIYLKYTGALDSDCTITIGPNTMKRVHIIENATTDSGSSGPYNIIIKQGSGSTVTIANGKVAVVQLDGAGSGAAVLDAFTDLQVTDSLSVNGTTLTIGDATAEDTKLVFDGNAQDYYIGLDDSADDLVIGLGSTVGTTPAIEIDENQDIKFAQSIGVGQAASSTTGDIRAQTMSLLGTTPTLTIGDAGAEDTKIVFDGNAQDFYVGLDDSADDLVIGLGSTVGTTPAMSVDENQLATFHAGVTLTGTTPTLTIGDAGAEDTKIVFDGNAQDFYIGLDDSADDLVIGVGSAVGTTPAIIVNESQQVGIGVAPTHNFNLQGTGTVEARFRSTDGDMSLQISSDTDEGQDSILEFTSGTSGRGRIVYDHNPTAASQKMIFKTGDIAVDAMTITGSGEVTQQNQPTAIYTHSAGSEAGAYLYTYAGSGTRSVVMKPQTAIVNRGNIYNTSNGRFTAPVAGVYRYAVHGNLYTNGIASNAYFLLQISKNGSNYVYHYEDNATNAAGSWKYQNYSGLISMAANDYIEMTLKTNNLTDSSYQNFGFDLSNYTHYEFQLLY